MTYKIQNYTPMNLFVDVDM